MAYATLTDLENVLHIDIVAASDPRVDAVLEAASRAIDTYCGVSFEPVSGRTELKTVHDRQTHIETDHAPITAITSISEAGTTLTADDYAIEDLGRIRRLAGSYTTGYWRPGVNVVSITYDGGYSPIPSDIVQACARLAADMYVAADMYARSSGAASERIGDYQVTWRTSQNRDLGFGPDPSRYAALLAPYRRVSV